MKRQERSDRTRERLLDATVDCLIELGYAKTSMNEICNRAGLSRGAQLHHFPTKAELMATAIQHLHNKQISRLRAAAATLKPGPGQISGMVDLMWTGFSGPLAKAAIELWVASSSDPDLRAAMLPVERSLARATLDLVRAHASPDIDQPALETLFWLTVDLQRGLAVDVMLGGDTKRRERLLDAWKSLAESAIADPDRALALD